MGMFHLVGILVLNQAVAAMPVRIPRTDLNRIQGSISLRAGSEKNAFNYDSPTYWQEYPTTLPPPRDGARGDYRDFKGCLQFQNLESVAVCFNVMPDVSSVGVNSREMTLQGFENFIVKELNDKNAIGCTFERVLELKFADAKREGTSVRVGYRGDAIASPGCAVAETPVQVEILLK